MERLLIIGLDGLDAGLVSKFEHDLPNLTKLRKNSPQVRFTSVFPPDSPTAWASIYTGLNPAKHGIVYFVDPLDKAALLASGEPDNAFLRGASFWDLAGEQGKKVCILFPHLGYPVWPVNGIMVGRAINGGAVEFYPPSLSDTYAIPAMPEGLSVFPDSEKKLDIFIKGCQQLAETDAQLGLRMFQEQAWDLFFFFTGVVDTIQHLFWNYCDEGDPTYRGDNPYRNVIKDFYILCDELVGRFLALADSDTAVMVLSDHGHGMRPVKIVNLNEVLRQEDLLVSRANSAGNRALISGVERAKRIAVDVITRYKLGNVARTLLALFPAGRRLYSVPLSIDWDKTVAHVSDLSGIKSYAYGGIKIVRENLRGMQYEAMRDLIIRTLQEVKEPGRNVKVVDWICRREELYDGPYISKYPDIVFSLAHDYGTGWAVHDSVFGTAASHSLVPGSHKGDSAVFLTANLRRELAGEALTIMDVAPTVWDLLELDEQKRPTFDGRSSCR